MVSDQYYTDGFKTSATTLTSLVIAYLNLLGSEVLLSRIYRLKQVLKRVFYKIIKLTFLTNNYGRKNKENLSSTVITDTQSFHIDMVCT